MELHRVRGTEIESVHTLLIANGWGGRVSSVQRLASLLERSQIAEVAIIEDAVAGFIRGITDGQSNGYLSMVVVAEAHRCKGIGRRLVEHAIGNNPEITWMLRPGRLGASEFFSKLGFKQSSIAMERLRTQSGA